MIKLISNHLTKYFKDDVLFSSVAVANADCKGSFPFCHTNSLVPFDSSWFDSTWFVYEVLMHGQFMVNLRSCNVYHKTCSWSLNVCISLIGLSLAMGTDFWFSLPVLL